MTESNTIVKVEEVPIIFSFEWTLWLLWKSERSQGMVVNHCTFNYRAQLLCQMWCLPQLHASKALTLLLQEITVKAIAALVPRTKGQDSVMSSLLSPSGCGIWLPHQLPGNLSDTTRKCKGAHAIWSKLWPIRPIEWEGVNWQIIFIPSPTKELFETMGPYSLWQVTR